MRLFHRYDVIHAIDSCEEFSYRTHEVARDLQLWSASGLYLVAKDFLGKGERRVLMRWPLGRMYNG